MGGLGEVEHGGLMRMDYLSPGVRFERRVVGNHSFEHLWRLQHRSTLTGVNTQQRVHAADLHDAEKRIKVN